jgi:hypothetical protein
MNKQEKLLEIINNGGNCPEGDTCNDCVLSGNFCNDSANCLKIAARILAELDKKEAPVSKFNVGDLVFCLMFGWGKVINLVGSTVYTVEVAFGGARRIFTEEGKYNANDLHPNLFSKEEALVKFPEFPPPRQMHTTTKTIFVNVYPDGEVDAVRTRKKADELAETWGRIACVETTISYEIEE